MKKIFIVSCLLTFAYMVSAQGGGGIQQNSERMNQYYEAMKKECNLNDKQVAEIKKLDEAFFPKLAEVFEKYGDNREKMTEEMTKVRTEQNTKVKPLLSADQFKKYEAFQATRFQRRQN